MTSAWAAAIVAKARSYASKLRSLDAQSLVRRVAAMPSAIRDASAWQCAQSMFQDIIRSILAKKTFTLRELLADLPRFIRDAWSNCEASKLSLASKAFVAVFVGTMMMIVLFIPLAWSGLVYFGSLAKKITQYILETLLSTFQTLLTSAAPLASRAIASAWMNVLGPLMAKLAQSRLLALVDRLLMVPLPRRLADRTTYAGPPYRTTLVRPHGENNAWRVDDGAFDAALQRDIRLQQT